MKFAICNEMFSGWTFDKACRFVATTGYDGIEIAPFTLAESVRDISNQNRGVLRRTIEDAGLELPALHWLLASPDGLYINHPDVNVRNRTVDYLKDLIDFCADLGGHILVFGSPKQRNIHKTIDLGTAFQYAAESFISVMPRAHEREVMIAFEPLAPTETDFINTAAEAVELIDAVGHPNFRLHLDVKAMCSESDSVAGILLENREQLVHVHANDANSRGPGFGDVDFSPIMKALEDIDYQDYLSVEVFDYTPDPETIAVKSLKYLKGFVC